MMKMKTVTMTGKGQWNVDVHKNSSAGKIFYCLFHVVNPYATNVVYVWSTHS